MHTDQNIYQHKIAIRKDDNGYYDTAMDKRLDCRTVEVIGKTTLLTSGTQVGGGKVVPAGSEWHPQRMPATDLTNTTLVDVLKLSTANGHVYATQSAYDTFAAACNACCGS